MLRYQTFCQTNRLRNTLPKYNIIIIYIHELQNYNELISYIIIVCIDFMTKLTLLFIRKILLLLYYYSGTYLALRESARL